MLSLNNSKIINAKSNLELLSLPKELIKLNNIFLTQIHYQNH